MGEAITATIGLLTFYGVGDGFMGQPVGAYWHGALPPGAPPWVTDWYPGVAANDLVAFPYGSQVKLTIVGLPAHSRHRQELLGRSAVATVVDWKAEAGFDAQPAVWRELVGGKEEDWAIGKVYVQVQQIDRSEVAETMGTILPLSADPGQAAQGSTGTAHRVQAPAGHAHGGGAGSAGGGGHAAFAE